MHQRLVTVHKFSTSTEAYLWKAKLTDSGIMSVVIHDTPFSKSNAIELQVAERDVNKALNVLKSAVKIKPIGVDRATKIIFIIGGLFFSALGVLFFVTHKGPIAIIMLGFGAVPIIAVILQSMPKRKS